MAYTFDVRATEQHGRIVFWEVDSRHPEGEVAVAGDRRTYTVAETPAVLKALANGEIARVQELGGELVESFDLTDLDNVGPARADALREAGIDSRKALLDADANELAETVDGVTPEMVAGWQDYVRE